MVALAILGTSMDRNAAAAVSCHRARQRRPWRRPPSQFRVMPMIVRLARMMSVTPVSISVPRMERLPFCVMTAPQRVAARPSLGCSSLVHARNAVQLPNATREREWLLDDNG